MRNLKLSLLLLLLVFFPSATASQTAEFIFQEPAQVIRIIDGDTFDVRWRNEDSTGRLGHPRAEIS